MSIHVCKQCGDKFEYCRSCVFRPVRYKDLGYCTKDCYEASKNIIEEVVQVEDVEVVVINEEDTSTPIEEAIECPYFFTTTEEEIIEEKEENKEDDYVENNGEDIRAERCDISDEPDSVPEIL